MADINDSREQRLAARRADYAANREREAAKKKAWYQKNKEWFRAYQRALYAADPSKYKPKDPIWGAYMKQKWHAKERNIPFLLSFNDWWSVWDTSGQWLLRGCRKGRYVMARFGDQGGYEVGNVKIITHSENLSEAHLGKPKPKRRRSIHGAGS